MGLNVEKKTHQKKTRTNINLKCVFLYGQFCEIARLGEKIYKIIVYHNL